MVALGIGGDEHVIQATAIEDVCTPLCRPAVSQELLQSFGVALELDEDYSKEETLRVDILIGLDVYWRLTTSKVIPSKVDPG